MVNNLRAAVGVEPGLGLELMGVEPGLELERQVERHQLDLESDMDPSFYSG